MTAGIVTGQLDHNFKAEGASAYGIVGGKNADGPENPVLQAAVSGVQAAASFIAQAFTKAIKAIRAFNGARVLKAGPPPPKQLPVSTRKDPFPSGTAIGAGSKASVFKDHYLRHRNLLEKLLGKKYPNFKTDSGATFLNDLSNLVKEGRFTYVGRATLAKDTPWGHVYRGEGLTLIRRQDGSFWTLLESGTGMAKALQFI